MQKSCACNFLYGPKTDVHHKEEISRALEAKEELKLEVILYKHKGRLSSSGFAASLLRFQVLPVNVKQTHTDTILTFLFRFNSL